MTTYVTPDKVVEHYSTLAEQNLTKNAAHIQQVAESFGYSVEDLAAVPEGANLGVSCGNPLAVAGLKIVCFHFSYKLRGSTAACALKDQTGGLTERKPGNKN